MPSFAIERLLTVAGVTLLAIAALTGFMQAREDPSSRAHGLWRVVHSGGTAGGVQLIALGAIAARLSSAVPAHVAQAVLLGVTTATWAFFFGPLLRALGAERLAARVNLVGALIAGPSYLALPLLLLR
jgi:hypothetical protein